MKRTIPPMSLRRRASEEAYQMAKLKGQTVPLHDEPTLMHFKHFRIITNRFPYDAAFRTSHMLIPRRKVATYDKLSWREKRELRHIIDRYCSVAYNQISENMMNTRSVFTVWHLHLLEFHNSRRDFKL